MTSRPPRVAVRALAKINLSLRVTGVRSDGYHELRTTFQSLALHDTLTFAPSARFAITSDDPGCPTDDTNLVWRAAERLWRADGRRGRPRGVSVHIAKRIPMQAGLGGGSSDAAAALRALAALWRSGVGTDGLYRLARDIGADVAFFLVGGTVLGLDRGDLLYSLADTPAARSVVLVQPAFSVGTKEAYLWWDAAGAGAAGSPKPTPRRHRSRPDEAWVNDLQNPVASRYPEINRLVRRLRALGASYAGMSGSGSVVFGLFGSQHEALTAADALKMSGRTVTVTTTVNRRQYQRLSRLAAS